MSFKDHDASSPPLSAAYTRTIGHKLARIKMHDFILVCRLKRPFKGPYKALFRGPLKGLIRHLKKAIQRARGLITFKVALQRALYGCMHKAIFRAHITCEAGQRCKDLCSLMRVFYMNTASGLRGFMMVCKQCDKSAHVLNVFASIESAVLQDTAIALRSPLLRSSLHHKALFRGPLKGLIRPFKKAIQRAL